MPSLKFSPCTRRGYHSFPAQSDAQSTDDQRVRAVLAHELSSLDSGLYDFLSRISQFRDKSPIVERFGYPRFASNEADNLLLPPPMVIPLTAAMMGFFPARRGRPARPGADMSLTIPRLFISFHSNTMSATSVTQQWYCRAYLPDRHQCRRLDHFL
ncbi:hypothetical protein KCU77_g86, partial [Aureobasidium melanogenum]